MSIIALCMEVVKGFSLLLFHTPSTLVLHKVREALRRTHGEKKYAFKTNETRTPRGLSTPMGEGTTFEDALVIIFIFSILLLLVIFSFALLLTSSSSFPSSNLHDFCKDNQKMCISKFKAHETFRIES